MWYTSVEHQFFLPSPLQSPPDPLPSVVIRDQGSAPAELRARKWRLPKLFGILNGKRTDRHESPTPLVHRNSLQILLRFHLHSTALLSVSSTGLPQTTDGQKGHSGGVERILTSGVGNHEAAVHHIRICSVRASGAEPKRVGGPVPLTCEHSPYSGAKHKNFGGNEGETRQILVSGMMQYGPARPFPLF